MAPLPKELIAQTSIRPHHDARLMVVEKLVPLPMNLLFGILAHTFMIIVYCFSIILASSRPVFGSKILCSQNQLEKVTYSKKVKSSIWKRYRNRASMRSYVQGKNSKSEQRLHSERVHLRCLMRLIRVEYSDVNEFLSVR